MGSQGKGTSEDWQCVLSSVGTEALCSDPDASEQLKPKTVVYWAAWLTQQPLTPFRKSQQWASGMHQVGMVEEEVKEGKKIISLNVGECDEAIRDTALVPPASDHQAPTSEHVNTLGLRICVI